MNFILKLKSIYTLFYHSIFFCANLYGYNSTLDKLYFTTYVKYSIKNQFFECCDQKHREIYNNLILNGYVSSIHAERYINI